MSDFPPLLEKDCFCNIIRRKVLLAGVARKASFFQTPCTKYILRLSYVHVHRNDSQVMDC